MPLDGQTGRCSSARSAHRMDPRFVVDTASGQAGSANEHRKGDPGVERAGRRGDRKCEAVVMQIMVGTERYDENRTKSGISRPF